MNFEEHMERIESALRKFGDLYSWLDVLDACAHGNMQMLSEGDSFVVVKIADFPKRRVLDIVLAYGDLKELHVLKSRVYQFGVTYNCSKVMATFARDGWDKEIVEGDGWERVGSIYVKDL